MNRITERTGFRFFNMNHSIQPNDQRFDVLAGNYSRSGFIEFARFWAKQSQNSSQQSATEHDTRSALLLKSLQSAEVDLYQALDGLYYYGQPERSKSALQNAFQSLYNWSRAHHITRHIEQDMASYSQWREKIYPENLSELNQGFEHLEHSREDEFGFWYPQFHIINRMENALNALQISDNRLNAVNTVLTDFSTYQNHAAYDPMITPYFHRLQKRLVAAVIDLILEEEHSISIYLLSAQFDLAEQCVESHAHLYAHTDSPKLSGISACKELIALSMASHTEKKQEMDAACQDKNWIHALQIANEMLDQFPHDEWVKSSAEDIANCLHQKEMIKTDWQKWCDLAMNPGKPISTRRRSVHNAMQFVHSREVDHLFGANELQILLNETNEIKRNVIQQYCMRRMAQSVLLILCVTGVIYVYNKTGLKPLSSMPNMIMNSSPTPAPAAIALGTINTAFKNVRIQKDFRAAAIEPVLFILYEGDTIELIEKSETEGNNPCYRAIIKKGHIVYYPENLKIKYPEYFERFCALIQREPEKKTVSKFSGVTYFGALKDDQYVWVYAGDESLIVQPVEVLP